MATISLTVPDAVLPRVLKAFGRLVPDPAVTPGPGPLIWVDATAADVKTWLMDQVKAHVVEYETNVAAQATRSTVQNEKWT